MLSIKTTTLLKNQKNKLGEKDREEDLSEQHRLSLYIQSEKILNKYVMTTAIHTSLWYELTGQCRTRIKQRGIHKNVGPNTTGAVMCV